mmetsp:Transcript_5229/g.15213  ORF Transcript_5229/g.15213 Transcript_5229/m.15213 type:complete len:373 (-) Transcript_5229:348-1466(-)
MELFIAFIALVALPSSDAFHMPLVAESRIKSFHKSLHRHNNGITIQQRRTNSVKTLAKSGDEELNLGPGMEDAFRELEALQSLEDEDAPERPKEKPKEKDATFAKAIEGLDLKDILSQADTDAESSEVSPQSEVELYKDMASELDVADSQEELIAADFKSDLELADEEKDALEGGVPKVDTQKFMDKAIKEALKEAKEQNRDVDITEAKESFLDNKEIMSEIEKIFDKANDDLLKELEEIRAEQETLAKEQAERNSKASFEKTEEYEKRMEIAQGNMKKMLERVNQESKNVEEAIEDLKRAQAESEGGIDSQLVDLKSGGLVKQAALTGALLFTFRSGVETIAFVAGDPSHALPALIQGAIALACIVGFIFL